MSRILHPLLALLASVTRQDLGRQNAYLKEENRILRSRLPAQMNVTAKERQRLIKLGRKVGNPVEGADFDHALRVIPEVDSQRR